MKKGSLAFIGYCTLLVSIGKVRGVNNIIVDDNTLTLEALDCKHNQVLYGKIDEFCYGTQQQPPKERTQHIVIAQQVEKTVTKAIKCTKTVSQMNQMCASWSHMKLLQPPVYNAVEEISIAACKQIYATGVYTDTTSQKTYQLPVNSKLHYQKVARGQMIISENNIKCEGETTFIGNVLHQQVMTFEDIVIEVQQVDIETDHTTETATDLSNRRQLDDSCYNFRSCISSNETYFKIEPENPCKLHRIKAITVEERTVNTEKGLVQLVVNHDDKIALQKGTALTPRTECANSFSKYYDTNVEQIYIIYEQDLRERKLERATGTDVNIRNEMLANDQYLSAEAAFRAENLNINANKRLCKQMMNTIGKYEKSPFTENAIIKQTGDLFVNIKCQPVTVSIEIGKAWRKECVDGFLPVDYEGKNVFISAGLHVIYDEEDKDLFPAISCKHAPYFITKENVVIRQNPTIEVANVTLTKFDKILKNYFDENQEMVEIYHQEGLYTSQEMEELNSLIHFGRKQNMMTSKLVQDFCQDGKCLGESSSYARDWSLKPENIVTGAWKWIEKSLWDILEKMGAYASLFMLVIYIGQALRLMYNYWGEIICCQKWRKKTREEEEMSEIKVHIQPQININQANTEITTKEEACNCDICHKRTHRKDIKLPRGHCGSLCCEFHTRKLCKPYEWFKIDPENKLFDHQAEDEKYKTFENRLVERTRCECDRCLMSTLHSNIRYISAACGCRSCSSCHEREAYLRRKRGIKMEEDITEGGTENKEGGGGQLQE